MPDRRSALAVLEAAFTISYPFVVFSVLAHSGTRAAALVLLGAFLVVSLRRGFRTGFRGLLGPEGAMLFAVLVLAGAAFVLRERGFVLLAPVTINAVFALTFGMSLRGGPTMIERFARVQDPDLTVSEVAWCRLWTSIWTGFFLCNILIISVLAWAAPLRWWVVYTGGIAYALMGVLFASEYVLRKARFGRYGLNPLDRALARVQRGRR